MLTMQKKKYLAILINCSLTKGNANIVDNIKASWLLRELADKTASLFSLMSQATPLNKRLTAIQSALFMIGYDVQCYLK